MKYFYTKLLFLGLFLISYNQFGLSNDSIKIEPSLNADVVSRYIWRGIMNCNSVSIQPSMELSYNDLCIGSWASYSVSSIDFQEVDLFLTYNYSQFTIGLNDYYSPVDTIHYFEWQQKETKHTLEPFVTWNGIAGTPFGIIAAIFAYGNDLDEKSNNNYSSYFEINITKTYYEYNFTAFIGGTPSKGFYAEKAALVNIGISLSKQIPVSKQLSIPCKGSLVLNPDAKNIFFVFGITL